MKSKILSLLAIAVLIVTACIIFEHMDVQDQKIDLLHADQTQVWQQIQTLSQPTTVPSFTPTPCPGPAYTGLNGFLLAPVYGVEPMLLNWYGVPVKMEVWGIPGGASADYGGEPNEEGHYLYVFTQVEHPDICPCYLSFEGYIQKNPNWPTVQEYWQFWGNNVNACYWDLFLNN